MAIAGRAAHLASREEDALALFGRAAAVAATEAERRDASWGELTCLIDLERPERRERADRLSEEFRSATLGNLFERLHTVCTSRYGKEPRP